MPDQTMQIDTPAGIQAYLQGHGGIKGIHVIRNSKGAMQMSVVSQGTVKGGTNNNEEKDLELNENHNLLVAEGMPAYAELSRLGEGWSAIATAAVAALVVRPTTVALFTLYNGNSGNGPSYVIDRLFAQQLVSGADGRFGIWACVHPAGMVAPGIDIAGSATNLTGYTGKTYKGAAEVGIGETVVNNGWYPWGNSFDVETTGVLGGAQSVVPVEGRLIIPPTGGLSLHVVATSTDEDFAMGASWYEVQLDLK